VIAAGRDSSSRRGCALTSMLRMAPPSPRIDPRNAARFKLTEHLRIVHALRGCTPTAVVHRACPGLTPGDLKSGLQTSVQTSAGVGSRSAAGHDRQAYAIQNTFTTERTRSVVAVTSPPRLWRGGDTTFSRGHAYGLEVFVHRRLNRRLGGFLTYTLSRTTRTLPYAKISERLRPDARGQRRACL
jgi:hypothetical protein